MGWLKDIFSVEEPIQEEKSLSKEIAEQILEQEDRLAVLIGILQELPSALSEWFMRMSKSLTTSKNYVEIDVANTLLANTYYPGDILILKNRDPKVGDVVSVAIRSSDKSYHSSEVKVTKINIKEGTLEVENIFDKDSSGIISPNNILYVLEGVVKFQSGEWKRLVNLLDLQIDKKELLGHTKKSIEFLKKTEDFVNKKENIEALEKRLKEINSTL